MHPARLPPNVKRVSDSRFWASFQVAFHGIVYATRTQRNMRVHLVAGSLALFATLYLRLERAYVALVVIAIVLVLAFELLNTAVEAVVDLMTVAHHPLAKIAKDAAAGAVLVASIGALIIGYLAFYEGVTAAGASVAAAVAGVPRNFVAVALVLTAVATVFAKAYASRRGTALQGGAFSGHAAVAFAGATAIALLGRNLLIALVAYFLAFLVSQSRVEGGIHDVREVAAGGLLGTGITLAIYLLVFWNVFGRVL
jgi:diacylglycerol kinase (ATP)